MRDLLRRRPCRIVSSRQARRLLALQGLRYLVWDQHLMVIETKVSQPCKQARITAFWARAS